MKAKLSHVSVAFGFGVQMYFVFDDDKHLLYFDNIELLQNGGYFPALWLIHHWFCCNSCNHKTEYCTPRNFLFFSQCMYPTRYTK